VRQGRIWIHLTQESWNSLISRVECSPYLCSDFGQAEGMGGQEGLADLGGLGGEGLVLEKILHKRAYRNNLVHGVSSKVRVLVASILPGREVPLPSS